MHQALVLPSSVDIFTAAALLLESHVSGTPVVMRMAICWVSSQRSQQPGFLLGCAGSSFRLQDSPHGSIAMSNAELLKTLGWTKLSSDFTIPNPVASWCLMVVSGSGRSIVATHFKPLQIELMQASLVYREINRVRMSNPASQPGSTVGCLTCWSSCFVPFIPLGKLHQAVCERPQVVTEHVDRPRHFRFDRFQAMAGCYDADRDREKRIDIDRFPPVIPMRLKEVVVLPDCPEVP